MRPIDISDSYFTKDSMIPENGNDITVLWGIKIVQNLLNGYGVIGTCLVEKQSPTAVSFPFTRRYQYPPLVHILVKQPNDLAYSTLREGAATYKQVNYAFNDRGIVFSNGPRFVGVNQIVVFRIHGT